MDSFSFISAPPDISSLSVALMNDETLPSYDNDIEEADFLQESKENISFSNLDNPIIAAIHAGIFDI